MYSAFIRATLFLLICGMALALTAERLVRADEGEAAAAQDESSLNLSPAIGPAKLRTEGVADTDPSVPAAEESAAKGKSPDKPSTSKKVSEALPVKETSVDPVAVAKAEAKLKTPPQSNIKLLDLLQKASRAEQPAEPSEFQGVRPGQSTSDDVRAAWGPPKDTQRQNKVVRQSFRVPGYDRVEVHFRLDKVVMLSIDLDRPTALSALSGLAKELKLEEEQAFGVKDEFGEVLGVSFPERGVALAFEAGRRDRRVVQVIIEPITAQPFLLRAEERMSGDYVGALQDLEVALALDPNLARGHWLRGRLYRTLGQIEAATEEITLAERLDPRNAQFRLTNATLMHERGEHEYAFAATKEAIELAGSRPELKALALNQLGDLMATASQKNFKQSLAMYLEAIKLVEPLAKSKQVATRRLAHQALLGAYLSSARAISWGHFQQKSKVVPQWLAQADAMADQMAALEANSDQGLRVCREALSASVGVDGKLDPTRYAKRALSIGEATIAATEDPFRRQYLHWELGTALYDALQACHARGDKEHAVEYGKLAATHLEAATADRQLEPMETYLLGRLYFRVGAVCASDAKSPDEALRWYERAMPLLEKPLPQAAQADAGRHGEAFVTMAVSYWAAGSQDESLRLTREGLRLMENAVEEGHLEAEALKTPYNNLATMHRHMGDDEQADAFEEMASKARTTTKLR
jgi:Tfp pilus assembly protein PilF